MFVLVSLAYVLIGISLGRYVYNTLFDEYYEDELKVLLENNIAKDEAEDIAYGRIKDRIEISGWSWIIGVCWPLSIAFALSILIIDYLALLCRYIGRKLGNAMPQPQATKHQQAKKLRAEEAKKLKLQTEQLERDIKTLKQENFRVQEAEEIVESIRTKLSGSQEA